MNCPVCSGVQLLLSERSGVEIDYCPQCRGVWLDRGELDKIIARGDDMMRREPEEDRRRRDDHDEDDHGDYRGHKRKRGGFFSDLFGGGDD